MEVALLVIVVALVCATLLLQLRGRRTDGGAADHDDTAAPADASLDERAVASVDADLVLSHDEVLVLPPRGVGDRAMVLGPAASLEALERAGIMTPRARRRPFQQLVDRITAENKRGERRRLQALADQPLEGGYLKLSNESRRQLAEGRPVVARTGEMLGMVNDEKGKRRHLLRFTDYTEVAANPNLVMAAANLQAMAHLQEQLEAVEERLIEVQKTLETLCKELDRERLAEIMAATEILEETASHVRRRGRMTTSDWNQVVATRLAIKKQLASARFNIADLTRDFAQAGSRHRRLEVMQEVLKDNRLDFWLSIFVESQLAHIRSDLLTLLHEATAYPESLGDLEQRIRDGIEARHRELAAVGAMLREIGDPKAKRWIDHLQQISHYHLSRQRPVIEGLLGAHGPVFAERPVLTRHLD